MMNREFYKIFRNYQELAVRYDSESLAVWCYYNPSPRPCFSLSILEEVRQVQQSIIDYSNIRRDDTEPLIRYLVVASQVPGVFNLGGDLALFVNLIREKNRAKLLEYAKKCINICYLNKTNMDLPVTTISLVEGAALGGGFECALSSNILIATKDAEMGFPEIRFNLFPGMGAYSFLARIAGSSVAEHMIASGEIYSGEELFEKGIVNHLAEPGKGYEGVRDFIRLHQRSSNARRALQSVRQCYHRIDYQELVDIAEIWADAALRLEEKNLRLMERLVKAQVAKVLQQKNGSQALLRTAQDRRFVEEEISFPLIDWSGDEISYDRRNSHDRRLPNELLTECFLGA